MKESLVFWHLRKIKRDGSLQVAAARLTRGLKLLKAERRVFGRGSLGKGKGDLLEKEPAAKRLKKEDSDVTLNSQGSSLFDSPSASRKEEQLASSESALVSRARAAGGRVAHLEAKDL